jgi:hypothetical protein
MGDADSARYELRFAFSLIARAVLLQARVFPLSRPELPEQLENLGRTEMARTLRRLGSEEVVVADDLRRLIEQARVAFEGISVMCASRPRESADEVSDLA